MNPNQNRPLPNAADKAALKAIATRIIKTCPSLQDTAHDVAGNLLKKSTASPTSIRTGCISTASTRRKAARRPSPDGSMSTPRRRRP